ncbi:hypothetical protein ES695_09255 [Candidatus Atribacteria bacterium 1244-E10-H5-B2]|nr:MAG: hypothetical protein ES695_09255 [Candidatus Atribacteria bacterium 1244-E10-H5-B2]
MGDLRYQEILNKVFKAHNIEKIKIKFIKKGGDFKYYWQSGSILTFGPSLPCPAPFFLITFYLRGGRGYFKIVGRVSHFIG